MKLSRKWQAVLAKVVLFLGMGFSPALMLVVGQANAEWDPPYRVADASVIIPSCEWDDEQFSVGLTFRPQFITETTQFTIEYQGEVTEETISRSIFHEVYFDRPQGNSTATVTVTGSHPDFGAPRVAQVVGCGNAAQQWRETIFLPALAAPANE